MSSQPVDKDLTPDDPSRRPGVGRAGEPTDQGLRRQPEGYQPPLPPVGQGPGQPAAWQPGLAYQHPPGEHAAAGSGPRHGAFNERDWGPSALRHGAYGQPEFSSYFRDQPGGGYGAPYPGPYGRPGGERRGPKDYVRSDERIREAVCERLFDQEWIDVSDVSVQVNEGCVLLEGTVAERRMKHAVEDIADSCLGVRDVDNRIRVRRFGSADMSPDQQQGPEESDN